MADPVLAALPCGPSVRLAGRPASVVECPMRATYDSEANAVYFSIQDDIIEGSAVENFVVERPDQGDIILDFDADGRLLGVEVIGATDLLHAAVLLAADRA
jgi:uncharacterized protein YuzE